MNELEFVDILKKTFLKKDTLLKKGIGDDCAIIKGPNNLDYLITGDGINEGVHFLKDESLEMIFNKLFVRNISDIYAMGGFPKFGLIFTSMKKEDTKNSIGIIKKLSKKFSINIIGGDYNYSEKKRLTMVIIGVQKSSFIYNRSDAKVGDYVYISGKLGLSFYGLTAIKRGIKGFELLKNKYHNYSLPEKVFLEKFMKNKNINAAIDISDGLILDAKRIAKESNVQISIDHNKIPIHREIRKLMKVLNVSGLHGIVDGGDDYEILFTSPKLLDFGYLIGRVKSGSGVKIQNNINKDGHDFFS